MITGTNLQLLLEMVLEREGLSSEEFRLQALECGHRGLTSPSMSWDGVARNTPLRKGYDTTAARQTSAD